MVGLLCSWQSHGNHWQIYYPFESRTVDVSHPDQLLNGFRYGPLVPDIALVWQCLLTNAGILIVAPTPDAASETAIAVLSLLPVPYRDPCLVFTEASDPRVDRLRAFKLVATTDESLAQLPFGVIVSVPAGASEPAVDVAVQYRALTVRHYTVLLAMMDFHLLSNPYFDILERPVPWDGFQLAADLNVQILGGMQATETFKAWRRGQITRLHTRSAFLSLRPRFAVALLADGQIPFARIWLERLLQRTPRDEHLRAVLEAHLLLLDRRMRPAAV
jgi:hypothetical protein